MNKFKIGDSVIMDPDIKFASWYSSEKFIIIRLIGENIVELNKSFNEGMSKKIHIDHLIFDIKEARKQKLEKICLK